jgi:hypothetical protein
MKQTHPTIERTDDVWLEEAGRLWNARSNRTVLDYVLAAWEPPWQAFLLADAGRRAEALGLNPASINPAGAPMVLAPGASPPFSLAEGVAEHKLVMAGVNAMAAACKPRVLQLAAEVGADVEQFRPEPERCTRTLTPRLKVSYSGMPAFHPDAFRAAWSRRCAWYDAERTSSAALGRMAMETLDVLKLDEGLVTGGGVSVRVYWRRREIDWEAARKALESQKAAGRRKRRPAA